MDGQIDGTNTRQIGWLDMCPTCGAGPSYGALWQERNDLKAEVERLRTLVSEHHNMNHWFKGTEVQQRVGLAQLGVQCAVCCPPESDEQVGP